MAERTEISDSTGYKSHEINLHSTFLWMQRLFTSLPSLDAYAAIVPKCIPPSHILSFGIIFVRRGPSNWRMSFLIVLHDNWRGQT